MELEWHQLDLRYEALRRRHTAHERQLLVSGAELGQQTPIIVINPDSPLVVIDGYKRVRALKRLGRDTVRSMQWSVPEPEALLLERGLRQGSEDTLDQAWLLVELQQRFGFSVDELARRFERGKSWVSRRLSLVKVLPQVIQDQVRVGILSAHADMKYLVPLARANEPAVCQLAQAIAPLEPSSRQAGALYQGWQAGTERPRELILTHPQVYLQAQASQKCSHRHLPCNGGSRISGLWAALPAARGRPSSTACGANCSQPNTMSSRTPSSAREPKSTACAIALIWSGVMLDKATRTAILKSHEQGGGTWAWPSGSGKTGRSLARSDPGVTCPL